VEQKYIALALRDVFQNAMYLYSYVTIVMKYICC